MTTPRVVVYASRYCGWCTRALVLLENKGVRPEIINIDLDRAARSEMEDRSGRRTVPQIFIGDRHIGGYDDLRALDTAGQLDPLLLAEPAAAKHHSS
ncbi:glutaredoxin 3 [Thioalkalivibrio sp. XN279]|uniref:glutaredoxin 3 n=1 Tax=Thioalkalivibrio sp. XN279 TaxID=2714953 RepID=UPI00140A2583|nr:glutaredoxin 3 [Thioalkalivibrio sp. XN279]NHA15827.1 glutaredoxin 3 [Thioalkalivibrio sp. XN279]